MTVQPTPTLLTRLTSILENKLVQVALVGCAIGLVVHSCYSAHDASRVVAATADTVKTEEKTIRKDSIQVKHDTITLTKAINRYQTLRDTVVIHDTVLVARADTVVRACESAVASTTSLADVERKENVTQAHEIVALKAEHPRFAPHLGVTIGPGVLWSGTKPAYGLVGAVGLTFTPF